jgi:SHS2 domain-containing protein
MCVCQTLLFPTSWTQITCESFYILFHFITKDISAAVETRTHMERFRFLASALNPVLIETDNVEEDEKAAVTFTVFLRHKICQHVNSLF